MMHLQHAAIAQVIVATVRMSHIPPTVKMYLKMPMTFGRQTLKHVIIEAVVCLIVRLSGHIESEMAWCLVTLSSRFTHWRELIIT